MIQLRAEKPDANNQQRVIIYFHFMPIGWMSWAMIDDLNIRIQEIRSFERPYIRLSDLYTMDHRWKQCEQCANFIVRTEEDKNNLCSECLIKAYRLSNETNKMDSTKICK